MTQLTMVEAIRSALSTEMERDDRVMVLGEDIGRLGGVYRATEGLFDKFGSDRVVDMPIAEASIIGASVGLAASGLVPVAELQFLGFGHLAFHQVAHQLARIRYRSQGRLTAPVTIRAPFGGGVRALEIHSDAYESMYANVPGLKVVAPATARDAKGMLLASIRDEDPVLFLEPLRGYRLVKDEVPDEDYTVELGKVRIAREGTDLTIVAWSGMVPQAERAAETLAAEGISAEVVDLRSITPLDVDGLTASVMKTGRAVVIQEGPISSGFAAEVATTITEEVFFSLEAPVQRVAGPDTPYPFAAAIEDFYLPGQTRILAAARKAMSA
ncbi:alpha-ketoacid dehydrogenase subunit beta [Rhodococcoides fascians]|uniref:alpha-ketoacid dehydrogenase subunit beta n=1 Tax=Rhodococcoides fascians TaxID=1828 RepID=UPI002ACEADEB|nr:alpha-ketoacid dehydrogenase subunit beta [Rhodococcus fascians]WQH28808.1 alpha-ketoacid dehydrogenase subunit beta [Rhodococcus fascians]